MVYIYHNLLCSPNEVGEHIGFTRFLIIMSPRLKVERHIAFGLFLCYYSFSSSFSSSSSTHFVRGVSLEWLDRSGWNFTCMMRVPWSVATNVNMFQYGCRCHGNDKNIQNALFLISSETVRPFVIKLHTNDHHHEPVLLHYLPLPRWLPLPWKPHVFEDNKIWIFYF